MYFPCHNSTITSPHLLWKWLLWSNVNTWSWFSLGLLLWSHYCQYKVGKKKDDKPLTDKLSYCSPFCCLKYSVAFGKLWALGCLSSLSFYLIWLSWYVSVRDPTAHLLDIKAICWGLVPPQDIALKCWACAIHYEVRKAPQQLNEIIKSAWKNSPSGGRWDDRGVFHTQPCAQSRAQM